MYSNRSNISDVVNLRGVEMKFATMQQNNEFQLEQQTKFFKN